MSSAMVPEYEVSHARPKAFFKRFTRKEELQHQTHIAQGAGTAWCIKCWRGH